MLFNSIIQYIYYFFYFSTKTITKFNLKLNNKILEKNILISIVVPTYNNENS